MSNKINLELENVESIIVRLYKDNNSIVSIYRILKTNNITIGKKKISSILKSNGVILRTLSESATKYEVVSDFFSTIDTEEKAYWLGFMYADGYVTGTKIVGCKLSTKDEEHLIKLRNTLSPTKPLYYDETSQGFGNNTKSVALILTNRNLFKDLVSKGCIQNKSKLLTFPNENIVPKELIHHFIRGYFDGDGSVTAGINPKGHIRILIGIVGTESFLSEIRKALSLEDTKYLYKYKNKDIHELKVGGTNVVKAIYNFLYKDATVFLERKYIKFKEYYEN